MKMIFGMTKKNFDVRNWFCKDNKLKYGFCGFIFWQNLHLIGCATLFSKSEATLSTIFWPLFCLPISVIDLFLRNWYFYSYILSTFKMIDFCLNYWNSRQKSCLNVNACKELCSDMYISCIILNNSVVFWIYATVLYAKWVLYVE